MIDGDNLKNGLSNIGEQVGELLKYITDLEKENAELKKEISILLSCSNCPENKGGYICEKEYNDKCLAQKIEYIKELKAQIKKMKNCANCRHYKHKVGCMKADKPNHIQCDVDNWESWEFTE